MPNLWKIPHMAKGVLSNVGPLYRWRLRRGGTHGTDSPKYCYWSWQRKVCLLRGAGFDPRGADVVELGPGDTLGVGLSALLSGVRGYTALDVFPFAGGCDLLRLFDEIAGVGQPYGKGPSRSEVSEGELATIREDLSRGIGRSERVRYDAPWSPSSIPEESADLVFSHCVLDVVDRLEEIFDAMWRWLRPGGFSYHWIACNAWFYSPYWNGHWAYTDCEWRLVRGGRAFFPNREPISTYLRIAESVGFEVRLMKPSFGEGGLSASRLARRYRNLDPVDSRTRGADLLLRKPL